MNVFKLIAYDVREGILKNKRYICVPILAILLCMYSDLRISFNQANGFFSGKPTFLNLFTDIFHGCDPIINLLQADCGVGVPYFWIGAFVFAVFISFDYMHNDLTQFGIQILTRSRKRSMWWVAKCVWCLLSSAWFYMLFILAVVLFSIVCGYELSLSYNNELLSILVDSSPIYSYNGGDVSTIQCATVVLSPFIVLCTLNMLQMVMCLFFKPMYSYFVTVCIVMLGMITDIPVAFSRTAMMPKTDIFLNGAYRVNGGIVICVVLIVTVVIGGILYFKRYNILPHKE